ncbi:hypothetical protein H6758_03840 [Candidatus Nomurabacteria bacterium]|nr:hypothetical protein [Candidatus Nomurabacteria bacterium]
MSLLLEALRQFEMYLVHYFFRKPMRTIVFQFLHLSSLV